MKKFYTFAIVAFMTLSASAAGSQIREGFVGKANFAKSEAKIISLKKVDSSSVKSAKAVAKDEKKTIEGDYDIKIGDYYFEGSAGAITEKATITKVSATKITISCDYFISDVTATINPLTGDITFNYGELFVYGSKYNTRFEPFAFDETAEDIVPGSFKAKFNSATGEITFPADHGFSWPVYEKAEVGEVQGFLDLFDVISMSQAEAEPLDEVQEGQWTKVGTATLEDAWITPSYSNTQTEEQFVPAKNPINCELQQSVADKNVYRLWKPYHDENWTLVANNKSQYEGQIVFDITDPAHVIVKAGMPAGFANSNGEFYVFGLLGWQISGFGNQYNSDLLPQIIAFMESKNQAFDTYENGVVTVNKSVFDTSASCEKAYSWTGNTYVVSKITMKINEDGVDEIFAADNDADAPVEFFNMQGQKVVEPAAGQLLIRRQGNKVSKVIVK